MEAKQPTETAAISPYPAGGAIYTPLHVERRVKIYPIQEHELTTLGMFSAAVTICSSIISGTAVFLLSVAWDMSNATDPATKQTGTAVIVAGCVLILICGGIGGYALRSRSKELRKILEESRTS